VPPVRDAVKRALPGWVLRLAGRRRIVARAWRIGRLTTSPAAFAVGELLRRDERAMSWTLRDGSTVVVRRGTRDADILWEIFGEDIYAPPARALAALKAIGRPLQIVDLGANVGLFGLDALRRFPGATVEAFEPDPANVPVLMAAVDASPHKGSWHIHPVAVGASDGTARFADGNKSDSFVVSGDTTLPTIDVEVRDVLPLLAGADYVKIDIEGAEWAILNDPRFAELDVRVIALEYHPRDNPPPDPRTAVESRLTELGYEFSEVFYTPEVGGLGQLWAWRTS
jgi:FkbM family methyltransferase